MMYREDFNESPKNRLDVLQKVRHIVMGVLFLAMAVVMLFPEQLKIEKFISYNEVQRYFFGGICLIYGIFRVYRAVKKETYEL